LTQILSGQRPRLVPASATWNRATVVARRCQTLTWRVEVKTPRVKRRHLRF
jgi:hypothetical protein